MMRWKLVKEVFLGVAILLWGLFAIFMMVSSVLVWTGVLEKPINEYIVKEGGGWHLVFAQTFENTCIVPAGEGMEIIRSKCERETPKELPCCKADELRTCALWEQDGSFVSWMNCSSWEPINRTDNCLIC